ncbi:MAG: MBL fold metallo-hydrolase [Anaerolineae bacterium]|nr:MBL fold metallo-hydrolase [Anaerolineae bacterium]
MHQLRFFALLVSLALFLLVGCAPTPTLTQEERIAQGAEKITWLRSTHPYGHTAIKIQTDERVIYLDPVDLVSIEELPKADIILITHIHPDHLSPDTIAALSKEGTKVVSIKLITDSLGDMETSVLAPGEKVSVDGLEIEGIPAYNASHTKESGYLGFIFTIDGVRIYCSGDTSLNPEMKALSDIDIAVMNVRNPYSLTGKEVVEFAEIVKPQIVIPIHWMPENNTYRDAQEIEYIQQNMPDTTSFLVLDLN